MNKIKLLREQAAKIRKEINEEEEKDFQKTQIPFLKSLVGKYFSYRDNGYGGGSSIKWNEYRKILEFYKSKNGSYYLIYENFHIDCNGNVTFEINSQFPYYGIAWKNKVLFNGYVKITKKEYDTNKKKALNEMVTLKKLKKELDKDD